MAASPPGRLTVTLPVQAWSDSQRVNLHDLLTAGQFIHGPFGLALTDAGEAAVRALLDLGARLRHDEAAGAEWCLGADLPGGEARIFRPLALVGNPIVLVELTAPPGAAESLAKSIHAYLGDSAFRFTDPRLLRRLAGEPEMVEGLWRGLLGRGPRVAPPPPPPRPDRKAQASPPPPPPPPAANGNGAGGTRKEPPRGEGTAAHPPLVNRGPPLDALAALGLTNEAVWDEIKRSYRTLALQLHPDRTGGDTLLEAELARVNEAYTRLKKHYGK